METRSNYVMVGAVTVALLAGVLLFIVWLAGLSNKSTKCYDIYFAQGVGGLNKGSNVSFSGVPVGQVNKISLLPNRPEFVWVRIEVDQQTPVLQGTTAQIKGVGFTGVSEIQLDGAVKGAPPITQPGPQGCPVLPSSTSGLGALLNSAPELIDRIQRLTERLTELLTDEGRPAAQDLRRTIAAMQKATENLDAMISDARPGVQNFSKSTLPEANRLVRDLRELSQSLKAVSERVEQRGIGGTLGPEQLPDYNPRKRK